MSVTSCTALCWLGAAYSAYDCSMFSYRHAFHAGNHADVLKHATLIAILQHMLEKDAALMVVDTHAGAGLYRLDGDYAQTSGESVDGWLQKTPRQNKLPAHLQQTKASQRRALSGLSWHRCCKTMYRW